MQKEDRATSSYRDLITPPLASCGKTKGAQTAAFVLLALTREKSDQNFDGAVYRRTNVIGERGSANDIEGWLVVEGSTPRREGRCDMEEAKENIHTGP